MSAVMLLSLLLAKTLNVKWDESDYAKSFCSVSVFGCSTRKLTFSLEQHAMIAQS
jgi:hypothetical protein